MGEGLSIRSEAVARLSLSLTLVLFAAPDCLLGQTLLASTNQGELVRIDLGAGTATLLGTAPSPGGWADLAFDPSGGLLAVSRQKAEATATAHLYSISPTTGPILSEIGDVGHK